MKECYGCKKLLSEKEFSKNKNNPDGLSYYCRECTKKQQSLHLFKENGGKQHEKVIIDELKKHKIQIDGFNEDKIRNLKITLSDFPGVMNSLLVDLPPFLQKYNLTYEEYKLIIKLCRENRFTIEPKSLNT